MEILVLNFIKIGSKVYEVRAKIVSASVQVFTKHKHAERHQVETKYTQFYTNP